MKRAQIQMMETIAILFVFFVLVGLGFIFYARILKSSGSIEKEEKIQLEAIEIAQKATFLPELECPRNKDSCIDLLKLGKAKDVMSSNWREYSDTFGFSKLYVNEIYPSTNSWNLYDNAPDDYRTKLVTHIPVSLFDARSEDYTFGVLSVEVYTK